MTILETYLLLITFALFLGLAGLWFSLRMERQKTGASVFGILFILYLAGVTGPSFTSSAVPGLFGFSPFFAIGQLYETGFRAEFGSQPTVFGRGVEWLWISIFLYVSFGAWLALMIQRNLKREAGDVRLLSGWQAVGSALFVNALLYAFMQKPKPLLWQGRQFGGYDDRYEIAIIINVLLLYWVASVALPSKERMKVWARASGSYRSKLFSDDGLVWPWVALGSLTGMVCLAAYVYAGNLSEPDWRLRKALLMLLVIFIFVTRDVLFLQWCTATHMKRPLSKGALFLVVYYLSAIIILASARQFSRLISARMAGLLTPYSGFGGQPSVSYCVVGAVLQLLLIWVLLAGIAGRIRQPSVRVLAQPAG